MKDLEKKMALESLDGLIAKCEEAMISPFKKKKKVDLEAAPEREEDEGEHETESMAGKASKPDLSDMDLEELLEMYQSMKD